MEYFKEDLKIFSQIILNYSNSLSSEKPSCLVRNKGVRAASHKAQGQQFLRNGQPSKCFVEVEALGQDFHLGSHLCFKTTHSPTSNEPENLEFNFHHVLVEKQNKLEQ